MNNRLTINTGLMITGCISLLLIYANIEKKIYLWGHALVKSKELRIITPPIKRKAKYLTPNKIDEVDSLKKQVDTSAKNFLLIGDSEVGGLVFPFAAYCLHNNHRVKAAMTWSSATDMTYANNDTLAGLLRKYKPDYIFMVIGLNQIYQTNFDQSIVAVQKIINQFGNTPYAWIGPANWVEDFGINELYANHTHEGSFFLSKNLKLERGPDGRHPNKEGYRIWMDSIAHWIMTRSRWKINMKKPEKEQIQINFPIMMLNAGKTRNNAKNEKNAQVSDSSNNKKTPEMPTNLRSKENSDTTGGNQ